MALDCDPAALAQAAVCLRCIPPGMRLPVLIRLFCRLLNMNCDSESLQEAARCVQTCLSPGQYLPALIGVLCQIANGGGPPGAPCTGLVWGPDGDNLMTVLDPMASNTELTSYEWLTLATVSGDVVLEGNNNILSIKFDKLVSIGGVLTILNIPLLATFEAPLLQSVTGAVSFNNTSLVLISLPSLATAGSTITFTNLAQLTAINLPVLTSVAADLLGSSLPALASFSAPNLVTAGGFLDLQSDTLLTSLNLNSLQTITGYISLFATAIPVISLPALTAIGGDCVIANDPNLTTLLMPNLVSVGGGTYLAANPLMTSLVLTSLQTCGNQLDFNTSTSLVSVDLSNLQTIAQNFIGNGSTVLNTVLVPQVTFQNGVLIDFIGCALLAASVNQILARCVASGLTTATINLSGGTNAAPTGQGILDSAALSLAGNTVTTN